MGPLSLDLFHFFTGSWTHSPRRPAFILKIAAESATLKSFHFGPASLLWLQGSWCTWILCKLSRLNKLLTLLRNQSECSLILIPVTLYFVFPPRRLECLHLMNEEIQFHTQNLQLLSWWDCWPCSLSAWIWKPGRGLDVRWVTVRILNYLKM